MVTLNWNGKSNFDEYKLHKIRFYLKVSFTSRVLKFFFVPDSRMERRRQRRIDSLMRSREDFIRAELGFI